MFYHVVRGTLAPGREEEALRLIKKLAERSNQVNPRAVVEIVRRVDGPTNEIIWLGKLASMADHEAGGQEFQADPQVQTLLKEGEELFTDRKTSFYEVL